MDKPRRSEDRNTPWDIAMMLLLLGSIALVFVYESLDAETHAGARRLLAQVDLALVVFFVLEWLWRVSKSRPHAGRYAWRNSWELLGMVPILLPLPSFLRSLRIVRLVRILRVFKTIGRRIGVWERIAKDSHLGPVALAASIVTLVGATLVWLLEKDSNVALERFSEALWWAIVTVTTVGYGDITPLSPPGRFIAAGLMVTGIGIIGLLASTLANALLQPKTDNTQAPVPARAGRIAAELQQLAELHAAGHLTDEEFARAKDKALQ